MLYDKNLYDKEKMRELVKNPFFREANKELTRSFELELKRDDSEVKVRKYLQEHPGASFAQVILETDVDVRILEELIDADRVTISITNRDRDILEDKQKEIVNSLLVIEKELIKEKRKTWGMEPDDSNKRVSGMYSKKDSLKNLK